jgi:hypothetical protein
MTSQEKELLSRFLQQMTAAQAGQKDSEADALIRDAVARQPDAAYLLVQRAMQLEQLLDATEARAQKLEAELEQARSASTTAGSRSTSFLGDPSWGARPSAAAAPSAVAQRSPGQPIGMGTPLGAAGAPAAAAGYQAAPPQAAAPIAGARPGWGSGMMGNVAATAAGVVGGAFLYQGIQGLMHRGDTNSAADHHQPEQDASAEPHSASQLYDDTQKDDLSNVANISDDDSSDWSDSGADSGDSDYA